MRIKQGLTIVNLGEIQNTTPNRELGDIQGLMASIRELGQLHNLVIDTEYKLLAGRRRYRALLNLGITEAKVLVVDVKNPVQAFKIMLHENTKRKPLTDPEQALMVKEFHEMQQARTAELFAENNNQTIVEATEVDHDQLISDQSSNQEIKKYWSQEDTAIELGTTQPVITKAIKIAEAVVQEPDLARLKGKQILREISLKEQQEKIRQEAFTLPDGEYHVIVCDAPWDAYPGSYDPDGRRCVPEYPTMSIEEIKSLDVPSLAAENCVLWFWGINRLMKEAFEIIDHWGFVPKTILTWVKPSIGLGRWLRGQTEHCILAIKGKIPWKIDNESTVLFADRREHSRKPDEFYELVEKICVGRMLDMFSREPREGWDQYGDETEKFQEKESAV